MKKTKKQTVKRKSYYPKKKSLLSDSKFYNKVRRLILKELKEYSLVRIDYCPTYQETLFWLLNEYSHVLTDYGIECLKKELKDVIKKI